IAVPLLRQGAPIGVIVLARRAVRPFIDKQIDLVTTFADQAVIAIENGRLFSELEQRTRQPGRSVGEQRALGGGTQARNPTPGLAAVLDTIVAKAVQLSGTDAGAIFEFDQDKQNFVLRSTHGMDREVFILMSNPKIDLTKTAIGWAARQ